MQRSPSVNTVSAAFGSESVRVPIMPSARLMAPWVPAVLPPITTTVPAIEPVPPSVAPPPTVTAVLPSEPFTTRLPALIEVPPP
jgi:hypothetical protein